MTLGKRTICNFVSKPELLARAVDDTTVITLNQLIEVPGNDFLFSR